MLIALALCNTVRVSKKDTAYMASQQNKISTASQLDKMNGMKKLSKQEQHVYEYTASSPDEKALVEACQR